MTALRRALRVPCGMSAKSVTEISAFNAMSSHIMKGELVSNIKDFKGKHGHIRLSLRYARNAKLQETNMKAINSFSVFHAITNGAGIARSQPRITFSTPLKACSSLFSSKGQNVQLSPLNQGASVLASSSRVCSWSWSFLYTLFWSYLHRSTPPFSHASGKYWTLF